MTQALDTERSAEGTPTGSSGLEAQALIREARSRQRKRRIGIGVAMTLMAAVGTYLGTGGFSSGGPFSSPFGPSGPIVARAGLARITFTSRSTRVGGCIPASHASMSTGTGSIDLRNHAIAYVVRGVEPEAVGAFSGCGFGPSVGAGRWLGTTFYTAGQGMPWKKVSSGARSWKAISDNGFNDLADLMTSPWALTMADHPGSVLHVVGPSTVNGEPATKYVGTTTLLAVENEFRTVIGPSALPQPPRYRLSSGNTFVPAPSAIPISLGVWQNARGQVLRITAIEPLYIGIYSSGGGATENAVEVPAITLGLTGDNFSPSHPLAHTKLVSLKTLRQQNAFEMTLTLSSYGVAPAVAAP